MQTRDATETSVNGLACIVTGTGGLGYILALHLAKQGGRVVLAGRNQHKAEQAVRSIKAELPEADICYELMDLANLSSVKKFAEVYREKHGTLDLLINNAGVMSPKERIETVDGFELQLGTNYLGHFALTGELLPLFKKSLKPRVVNVTSLAYRSGTVDFSDLQKRKKYNPFTSYAQSKLCQLLFTYELQQRCERQGLALRSNAAHPGWARTELFNNGPGKHSVLGLFNRFIAEPFLSQSAEEGALSILRAALDEDSMGNDFFGPSGLSGLRGKLVRLPMPEVAMDKTLRKRLWDVSEDLTGLHYNMD